MYSNNKGRGSICVCGNRLKIVVTYQNRHKSKVYLPLLVIKEKKRPKKEM